MNRSSKITQIQEFRENLLVGVELFHLVRQTDEANNRFPQLYER